MSVGDPVSTNRRKQVRFAAATPSTWCVSIFRACVGQHERLCTSLTIWTTVPVSAIQKGRVLLRGVRGLVVVVAGSLALLSGAVASSCSKPTVGFDCYGNKAGNPQDGFTMDQCCDACEAHERCTIWQYGNASGHQNRCWLKTGCDSPRKNTQGCQYGPKGGSPPSPSPSPSPSPPPPSPAPPSPSPSPPPPPAPPAPPGPPPKPGKQHTLDAPTSTVIALGCVVVVYLVVGMGINKAKGQTGLYVLPHIGFWRNLCGLVKDGFGFFKHRVVQKDGAAYQPYEVL